MIPVVVGSNPIGHPTFPKPAQPQHWRPPARERYASTRSAFVAVRESALEQIRLNAAGFLRSADPEFLHQLRVALRRLRAGLRAFRRAIPGRGLKAVARKLKRFSKPLGSARDWDVLCETVGRDKRLGVAIQAGRDAARRRARKAVRSDRFAEALASAEALAAGGRKDIPLKALAGHALEKNHRKVLKAARRMRWDDDAARHALRIRVKRLRYCCDYFSPCYRASSSYIESVKALQEILGELNDIVVGRALLESLPRPAPDLRSRMELSRSRHLRRLPLAWRAFEAEQPFWQAAR